MGFKRNLIFGTQPHDALHRMRSYYGIERDFINGVASGEWTIVQDGTGTFTNAATAGGWLSMATRVSGTSDNDEQYAKMPSNISFTSTQEVAIAFSMKLTEANTDDANIILGVSSTGSADTLVDDGGGPPSSYSGAVFFKVDGNLEWQTETSKTTTQQTTATAAAYASGTAYELIIHWDGVQVLFYVNGALVATHAGSTALPAVNMGILLGVKNGGANVETLLVDWIYMQAARVADGSAGLGFGSLPIS